MAYLEEKITELRAENLLLTRQLKSSHKPYVSHKEKDNVENVEEVDMLLVLTKKLQDAATTYDEVKQDVEKLKEVGKT